MKAKKLLAVIITMALLLGLFQMTSTNVSAADTTVNFDQMACPSNDGMYLGYYCFSGAMADSNLGSINWGGLNHPSWYVSYYGPASNGGNAGVGPKSLYLNQGNTGIKTASCSFTLPAGKVFKSIWAQGNGSVTISSPGNTSRTFTFASAGAEMTLETNWTTAAAVVTFSVTNPDDVWGTEFRNLVYGDPEGGTTVATTTVPTTTNTTTTVTKNPDDPDLTYYVSTTGNDSADGKTVSTAFKTIQKAADVLKAGDTCYILGGTYRETVIPKNSGIDGYPITFKNYNDEKVIISGADLVTTSWSVHSGSIYKTDIGSKSVEQVFVDGFMNIKARWPNLTLSAGTHPTGLYSSSGKSTASTNVTTTNMTINSLNVSNLDGAKLWFRPGEGWVCYQKNVTGWNNTSKRLDFTAHVDSWLPLKAGDQFYIHDALSLLDAGGEWFVDKTGSSRNLYLQTIAGDSPANHVVEIKGRDKAIDFNGVNHVTFDGINAFGATVTFNNSNYCEIKNGSVLYTDSFDDVNGYASKSETGVVVKGGSFVTIDKMEIAYAPGNGVTIVEGVGHKLSNSNVHDVNYVGGEYANVITGVDTWDKPPVAGRAKDFVITNNKLTRSGKCAIIPLESDALQITHNDMIDIGLVCKDLGAIYAYKDGGVGGVPSVIAYNRINNVINGSGIYFDCYTHDKDPKIGNSYSGMNFIIHHNVITGASWSAFHVNGGLASLGPRNLKFYNNTIYACGRPLGNRTDWAGTNYTAVEYKNNIGVGSWDFPIAYGTTQSNNFMAGIPLFVNASAGDFNLQEGSPCRNAGVHIPGITDGFLGSAPDQGAFEFGVNTTTTAATTTDNSTIIDTDIPTDTTTAVPPLKGDINLDGKINGMDLLLMKQHILDVPGKKINEGTPAFFAADMNDDGKINGMDLLLLKKKILG